MTYNVFDGMLSLTQSIKQHVQVIVQYWSNWGFWVGGTSLSCIHLSV